MAHIVGVPKREPCQKCSLPVFLAERLIIGKQVYHRTCLRCARCNSQLTPGSFYETEVDGVYCCETCPDEETKMNVASTSKENKSNEPFGRKSIAERLAFFENDGSKVLQKSLSDEEKSQSLKKLSETQLQQTMYKPNAALNSFMSHHLSDAVDSASHNTSRRTSNTSINSSSISDEDESEGPPELPKSLPPSSMEVEISGTPSLQPSEASLQSSLVDSSISLDVKSKEHVYSSSTENENKVEYTTPLSPPPSPPSPPPPPDQEEPSVNKEEQIIKDVAASTIENDLILSVNVTKDSSEDDEQMRTRTQDPTSIDRCKESSTTTESTTTSLDESKSTPNRSSMVRTRLHQFEVIANKSQDSSISSVSKNNRLSNFSMTKRRSIDEEESRKYLETEVPKNVSEINGESHHDSRPKHSFSTDQTNINMERDDASYATTDKREKVIEKCDDEGASSLLIKITAPTDNSRNEELVQMNLSADKVELNTALPAADSNEILCDSSPTGSLEDSQHSAAATLEKVESKSLVDVDNSMADISKTDEYPEELNPFNSDDENEEQFHKTSLPLKEKRKSLNPFGSSDEEVDECNKKTKPPRPPPPKKISTNPFGSESEDEGTSLANTTSNSSSTPKRTPIPAPRNKSTSQNPTPEPTPRIIRQNYDTPLLNSSDYYGSTSSLSASGSGLKSWTDREYDLRGSTHSLASSSGSGATKHRKKKAPAPPPPTLKLVAKELFSPNDTESKKSSPGSSTATTPTPQRKKRPAPAPPKFEIQPNSTTTSSPVEQLATNIPKLPTVEDIPEASTNTNVENKLEKLCDEEKALLENNFMKNGVDESFNNTTSSEVIQDPEPTKRRLIALDVSLVEDANTSHDLKTKEEENVVYRRTIVPLVIDELTIAPTTNQAESHDRQLEKLKDNKEAQNRNRQSQISLHTEENDPLYNKSIHGKWKRRKGPAPALPIPPKKVLQMLPLQEIRHELEIIEVQQQGLEKQGVMLEKMIRERCEGPTSNTETSTTVSSSSIMNQPNTKEVEDLILQLFELVNEKNELFRRRRQHRLEQEQADLEYEIRVLMAQPERNKTDSDKAREEALIGRLVEVVQLRNEVIECLEMDRLREAEEDMSIKQRLEMHSAQRDEELCKQTPTKLSKKEKKKQKELKKLGKSKKLDADKDADESELNTEKQKAKKKKKKFLF